MHPVICMCCGEPMKRGETAPAQNPNLCAECTGWLDDREQSGDVETAASENDDFRLVVEDSAA